MELIDRYIYAVTQKLPESQREDIASELRGLIEDMLEERVNGREVHEEYVEEVLQELGNPKKLAQKYRGTKRYLIGPEYFDTFLYVLKIVLIAMSVGIGISFVIQIIINPVSILDHFIEMIISIFTGLPMAVGWTIIGFAIAEYYQEDGLQELKKEQDWKPSDLPPIPNPKGSIKRSESIAGIVFLVIIMAVFAFSTDYFGVWFFQENGFRGVVPFLNEGTYVQWFLLLILGLGILKEVIKLIYGKWSYHLVMLIAIINIASFVGVLFMINGPDVWNPNFINELIQRGLFTEGSEAFHVVTQIWNNATNWILAILAIGLIWDIVDGVIKTVRSK
ncbi:HAAS signaling domain-containing protein [Oceanobacillus halophilus]|uniref:Uncharacterized protein n=1 Tax=Oceanobacillus halophilus TaxID=930130 RepID=A0A495A1E5_9BACI|nr:hypothetical protein [Oceanobacillus halophilus]RKQ33283.1 hypothetical protein D8M06_10965 [Oceanobacillus halophilus]